MEVVHERCCGLDVHKDSVVAGVVVPGTCKQPHKEIRTFNTMTADLLQLADWLTAQGVTHVALESTGCTGKRPGTSWRARSRCCWSMRSTSSKCPAARQTCGIVNGSPTSSVTACCGRA